MRFALGVLVIVGSFLLGAACSGSDSEGGSGDGANGISCDPGENIFCRCPGGEAGTKTCRADGKSFDPCVGRYGECQEVTGEGGGEPTGGSSAGGSSGTGGSGEGAQGGGEGGSGEGGSGEGGSGSGGLPLFAACLEGADCESGECPMGYCTKACAAVKDCPLGQAECVVFKGNALCMPTCVTQDDCDEYGPPSECGYTPAIDDFPVTTCGDWLGSLALPPDGSDCAEDVDCNLGHEGLEHVCAFGACTEGCYVDADCPPGETCPSQGETLDSCEP